MQPRGRSLICVIALLKAAELTSEVAAITALQLVKTYCNAFIVGLTENNLLFGRPYYRSSLWYSVSSVCLLSVCLSVTFCIVAKWCILAKKCLKE